MLTSIEVIDFDLAVARRHAAVWARLEAAGNMIGAHDLQIAATALHDGHDVAASGRASPKLSRYDNEGGYLLATVVLLPFRLRPPPSKHL